MYFDFNKNFNYYCIIIIIKKFMVVVLFNYLSIIKVMNFNKISLFIINSLFNLFMVYFKVVNSKMFMINQKMD